MTAPTDFRAQRYAPYEPALAKALAAIEAAGELAGKRQRLIDTDPELIRLRAMSAAASAPHFADGMKGGLQVFGWLSSPDAEAKAEIGNAIRARINEISRNIA